MNTRRSLKETRGFTRFGYFAPERCRRMNPASAPGEAFSTLAHEFFLRAFATRRWWRIVLTKRTSSLFPSHFPGYSVPATFFFAIVAQPFLLYAVKLV